jgi:hypothetical protein
MMAAGVNLMTERALLRTAAARVSQCWAMIIGAMILLAVPGVLWTWRQRQAILREHDALEASYEPVRRLAAANRVLAASASDFVAREKLPLELARKRSVVALIAHVSASVAASEGAVFLERLELNQRGAGATEVGMSSDKLTLEASTSPAYETSQLIAALNRPPLSSVKIVSTETIEEGGASRKKYVIECKF